MHRKFFILSILCAALCHISKAQEVGKIEGVFDVTDMGGSSFSIPIAVLSGIHGVQPTISLNYSSQQGNGVMGIGWTLSGVSAVSRAPSSVYNDLQVSGVKVDESDRLTLDNNRLILTSGNYGKDASSYKTEIESYKEIAASGTAGTAASTFTVTDQNGWQFEYGGTANARAFLPGSSTPYMWLMNKVSDLYGNYMTYEYLNTSGTGSEVLPANITYTSNSSTGAAALYRVSFSYQSRPDPNFSYLAGGKIVQTMRLTEISVQERLNSVWTVIRSYKLDYDPNSTISHLIKVTQKGYAGSGAAPAFVGTEFTYGTAAPAEQDFIASTGTLSVPYEFVSGDYNGDGKADLIQYTRDYSSTNNTYQLYISTGSGFSPSASGNLPNQQSTVSSMENVPRNAVSSFFDYNGDGKDDFIYKSSSIQSGSGANEVRRDNYSLMLSNGTGLDALLGIKGQEPNRSGFADIFNSKPYMGDFDGDGKIEVLILKGSLVDIRNENRNFILGENYVTTGTDFINNYLVAQALQGMPFDASYVDNVQSKLYVIDYDGDGKNEILSIWRDNGAGIDHAQVLRMNVTFDVNKKPVIGNPAFVLVNEAGYPTLSHETTIGDFNGDGISDVLTFVDNVGWEIGYGKGNGQMNDIMPAPISGRPNFSTSYRPVVVADYDGDGKSDIFTYSNFAAMPITPTIYYSKGNHTFTPEAMSGIASKINSYRENYWLGDFNGDGGQDFITKKEGNWPIYQFSFHSDEMLHLVSKIKDDFGAETKITYQGLGSSNVYQLGTQPYSYPYNKRTLPIKVVSLLNSDNGINTSGNNTYFFYTGLKMNSWGKGVIGFDKISIYDAVHNITTDKTFSLNQTYALPYISNITTKENSLVLTTASTVCDVYAFGSNRIFPYVSQTREKDYVTNKSIRTDYRYNLLPNQLGTSGFAIGKPLEITTRNGYSAEVNPGQDSELELGVQTFSFPLPTIGMPAYKKSKPLSMLNKTKRSGQPEYARLTNFSYDAYGAISSSTADPGTSNFMVTSYSYDAYGNITWKMTSTMGITDRVENFEYDASHRMVSQSYTSAYPDVKMISVYDPVFGNVNILTKPDGYMQTSIYDGFGRIKKVTDNTGKEATTEYVWSAGNSWAPANARYATKLSSNDAGPSYEFYDRLGRLIRTARSGFSNTIYEDVVYNIKGEVASSTRPYFPNQSPSITNFTYDSRGRLLTVARPEGSDTKSYAIAGNTYITTETTSGVTHETTQDLSGKITQVKDAGGVLSYTYNSMGKAKEVSLSTSGVVAQYEYNEVGMLTKKSDPNYGSYEYTFNPYGETLTQKKPDGSIIRYEYDNLGSVTKMTTSEGATDYKYNYTPGSNCGKMVEISGNGTAIKFDFGMGDRINYEERSFGTDVFRTSYAYDAKGRTSSKTFPNGKTVLYSYSTSDGSLMSQQLNSTTFLHYIWQKNEFDQPTKIYHGWPGGSATDAVTTQVFDVNGLLKQRLTNKYEGGPVTRNMTFDFSGGNGTLSMRNDVVAGRTEWFTYDNLNRLVRDIAHPNLPPPIPPNTMTTYFENGNIKAKSDAGTFGYDQANRVSTIDPYVNIPDVTQNIQYNALGNVKSITEGDKSALFYYWANGEKAKMEYYENNVLKKTKFYVGNYEKENYVATGSVRDLCYINDADANVAAILETKDGVNKRYTVLTDYLGSLTHIIDEAGNIVVQRSYDAYGRMRNQSTLIQLPPVAASDGWDIGFTGHEHLREFGLINMRSRLYDPLLGRMVSPDPYIMGSNNSQGYNRYTYALNNPLSYNDPQGEWINYVIGAIVGGTMNLFANQGNVKSAGDFLKYFGIGAAVGAFTNGVGTAVSSVYAAGSVGFITSGMITGATAGFVGGVLTGMGNSVAKGDYYGSTVKAAVTGGIVGGITGGIVGGVTGMVERLSLSNVENFSVKGEGMEWNGEYFESNEELRKAVSNTVGDINKIEKDFETTISLVNKDNVKATGNTLHPGGKIMADRNGTPTFGTTVRDHGWFSGVDSRIYIVPGLKGTFVDGRNIFQNVMSHELLHAYHMTFWFDKSAYGKYSESATSTYDLAFAKYYNMPYLAASARQLIINPNYPARYSWKNLIGKINLGIK